jgi:hypothetical protein
MIREQQITENTGSKVVAKAVPAAQVSLDRILMATDFSPASDGTALRVAHHRGTRHYA